MRASWVVLLALIASYAAGDSPRNRRATVTRAVSTFFDPGEVAQLRARARDAARLRDVAGDGRWRAMDADPARVVQAFDRLSLAPGWALRGYVVYDGFSGRGIVWATPERAPQVTPDDCEWREGVPRPPGGVGFLEAIRGDGSPASFLQASLLTRQLMEMGAAWHSLSWTHQHLVMVEPADWERRSIRTFFDEHDVEHEEVVIDRLEIPRGGPAGEAWSPWMLQGEWPRDWRPEVRVRGTSVEARFHVLDEQGTRRLLTIVDRYRPPSLVPESRTEVIAVGGPGFVY